ncbi:VPDSG-CTERM sorting domain-containing protein [Pelagicoccus sp. SDUM812003]|uniref:VPDSG-CTERM sorting domain-containing protein n=1 Tax=Pelagicoccus sp. SDUM812003 TaxID=3041267 RepID=UPI00280E019D|nr:VPDSG-CTERM sorting domain-containing protein [Pelagicoccus sp. SDUM812003]MDQ8203861.1 VPDSG-CTERM sorting domain-containing protein [Pelagicoccus sp. SDUM812003]
MKKFKLAALVLSVVFLAANTVSAIVMNVTVDGSGDYLQDGNINSDNSLASVAFYQTALGISSGNPNGRADNFKFLETVVKNWNDNNSPQIPDAVLGSTPTADNGNLGDISSYTTVSGFDYVVFHFGNGPAGGGNDDDEKGWWAAWYLGGQSATFGLPQEGSPLKDVGGFSTARYFNPTTNVPDSGTTLALLGLSLLGLIGIRRFRR